MSPDRVVGCSAPARRREHEPLSVEELRRAVEHLERPGRERHPVLAPGLHALGRIAAVVEHGCALKLDVRFDLRGLWAHDLQGRASAFQRPVAGGMDLAAAASGVLAE